MKVLLFGTGDYYERYKTWFDTDEIVVLIDNSPVKQNTSIDGIQVLSPEKAITLSYDYIIIMSFYIKAMKKQLMELGVSADKIYHFYDLHDLFQGKKSKKEVAVYQPEQAEEAIEKSTDRSIESSIDKSSEKSADISSNKILLMNQDLTYGGPALALLHAARILVKHGYQVTYASMIDGPLRHEILAEGIPVIVDENLLVGTMKEAEWIHGYSLVICNTINYHVFLSERDLTIPVIWWLHDSAFFYDGVNRAAISRINHKNLHVCSVGQVPMRQITKYMQNISVNDQLLYGVEDCYKPTDLDKLDRDKISFVTIGYIEQRKGQDILVQAIQALPDELRRRAVFYFIGQKCSLLAQKIEKEVQSMPEIILTGPVDREKIDEYLNNADAMICPSREDPMPTVAAEAMMHNVPCIVSDATGTADYITHKKNGLVFHSEDVTELEQNIEWCIREYEKLRDMGCQAREIYENKFSIAAFEKSLMAEVNGIIGQNR